jgi:hypothetical protein
LRELVGNAFAQETKMWASILVARISGSVGKRYVLTLFTYFYHFAVTNIVLRLTALEGGQIKILEFSIFE